MIALAFFALQQAVVVHGRAVDARSGTPVRGAAIAAPAGRAVTDDDGRFTVAARPGDTLRVARVGYRARVVLADTGKLTLALDPVALRLTRMEVRERGEPVGRVTASRGVADARVEGALETSDAVAHLPFVTARAGQGGAMLSMRGSRAEQVLVVLDGLPLNDPATGTADLSDIPLGALGSLTAAPGTDAASWGSGASGGVVLLAPASGRSVTLSAASFGARGVEGASGGSAGSWRLRAGGALSAAENDFRYTIDRHLSQLPDSTDQRRDADERRGALFLSAASPRVQLWALGALSERGLPRPVEANIGRLREERRTAIARAQATVSGWATSAGVRALDLTYRDPDGRSATTTARSLSVDADVARAVREWSLRLGGGADGVTATRLETEARPRAFASVVRAASLGPLRADAALRADALRGAGAHLSPSLAIEWPARLTLFARVGQGFRAPTFYDLYFASQVALQPRPVRPERVLLDGEAGARWIAGPLSLTGSAFVRRTHDAIVWLPGSFSWSPANVPSERVLGAEGRAQLGRPGDRSVLEAWAGSYDTRATIDGIEVPTPYAPFAAGGAVERLTIGASGLSATLTALGRRPAQVGPSSRATQLPGVALVDLALSHHRRAFGADALLVAGVRDVGDVRWEPVSRFPAPGRSWIASLTLTF